MTTIAAELTRRYLKLQEEAKELNIPMPLPKVPDDLGVTDLVFFLVTYAFPYHDKGNHAGLITTAAALRFVNLTQEQVDSLVPKVRDFLGWAVPILRTRG